MTDLDFFKRGFLVLWIIMPRLIFGQGSNDQLIPNVTPPSPESAQLGKFGQYPVNHFTGLVNIDIPIYEVKAGEISVPISIKYHPSGIKVTDKAGLVGLGWALDAGGNITRNVMGEPDETPNGYLRSNTIDTSIDPNYYADLAYLNDVNRGIKDTEPDIFSYSIGSMSGKFLFNQLDSYAKVMIPYNPITINHTAGNWVLGFDAYDQFGSHYLFVSEETSNFNDNYSISSAWKQSKIISRTLQDTISFTYTQTSGTTFTDLSDYITVDDLVDNKTSSGVFSAHYGISGQSLQSIYSTERVLTQIDFPLGKIVFTLEADRQDGYLGQKRLDTIWIYRLNEETGSYSISKSVKFFQSYFQSANDKRLKLDSLQIKDAGGIVIQRYRFAYNLEKNLPDHNSKRRDYWGYFNNKPNSSLVPRQTIPWQSNMTTAQTNITIGSNFTNGRDVDPNYNQAWVLNKIMYPTGGWSEFEYESNKYLDENQNAKYAGGLRISKIRSYDSKGATPLVKTFKYGAGESGYGRKNFIMNNYSFQSQVTVRYLHPSPNCQESTKRQRTFVANPSIGIEPYDGSPVVYPVVTVYEGDETSNNGKVTYEYSDYVDNLSPTVAIGVPAIESYHYKRGQLLKESTYKNESSTYSLVQEVTNTYGAYSDSQVSYMGLKVKKSIINTDGSHYDIFIGVQDACHPGDHDSYQYTYFRVITGDAKLTGTTVKNYNTPGSGNSTQTTTYSYANFDHQQVTQTLTSTSKGETLKTITQYPHENIATAPYNEMVQKHMIAFPVKEETWLGTNLMSTVKRNYSHPFTNVYEPNTITKKIGNGNEYTEIKITKYDTRGNVLEFVPKSGVTKSIIWGYKGQLPIAEIANETYAHAETALGGSVTLGLNGLNLNSIQVNQLRANLPNSHIATYAFYTGRCLKSISDPAAINTYFEYDLLGRLSYVENTDQHIVKAYNYNYRPHDYIATTQNSLNLTSSSQTTPINITSNTSWTVSDDQTWMSLSPTSGTGNGTVTVTLQTNNASDRYGTISVNENGGAGFFNKKIAVEQAGFTPTLQISTTSLTFPGTTTRTFTITSNISWSIYVYFYDSYGWLTVSPLSGSGNATISVTSSNANTNGQQWHADLQISGSGINRIVSCVKYY